MSDQDYAIAHDLRRRQAEQRRMRTGLIVAIGETLGLLFGLGAVLVAPIAGCVYIVGALL